MGDFYCLNNHNEEGDNFDGYSHWLTKATQWLSNEQAFVVVTIIATQGSAPQKSTAKMLISDAQFTGTVGGGELEEKVIFTAREILQQKQSIRVCVWTLGASMGQCCGGKVAVLFEFCSEKKPMVAVFGLGHVGREVALLLGRLPYQLLAVNTYGDVCDSSKNTVSLSGVQVITGDVDCMESLPKDCNVLIMTHSHDLDFKLCDYALSREQSDDSFNFIGVIGSVAKATKFRSRFLQRGINADKLVCPIGKGGVYPAEIAVSIVADLVAHLTPSKQKKDKQAAAIMKAIQQVAVG